MPQPYKLASKNEYEGRMIFKFYIDDNPTSPSEMSILWRKKDIHFFIDEGQRKAY
jgi:hypothetical protein